MSTFKVVYNDCYGGFDLHQKALDEYNKRSGKTIQHAEMIAQTDPILIELVEEMGKEVNSKHSKLKIAEFPLRYKDFLKWSDYDGLEKITVDFDRYLAYHTKKIVRDDTLTDHEKIDRIQRLFEEEY